MKKVWIDITNSPHVLFFNPIIKKLKSRGYDVVVTARDFAQVYDLLDEYQIEHVKIGNHKGKNKFKKVIGLIERTSKLKKFAKNKKIDIALSLGSNDLALVAWMLKIPHMTLFDYEYAKIHHLNCRFATKIIVPSVISNDVLYKYGATVEKLVKFNGLKEDFYIHHYVKKDDFLTSIGIDKSKVIITIRPHATEAHYQSNENNILEELLLFLSNDDRVKVIVTPRNNEQSKTIKSMNLDNLIVLDKAVDGFNLISASDMVISAGGTMNREAAALNIPVYSLYKGGTMGAVDCHLVDKGKMILLESKNDFSKISIQKRNMKEINNNTNDLLEYYIKLIIKNAK